MIEHYLGENNSIAGNFNKRILPLFFMLELHQTPVFISVCQQCSCLNLSQD